MSKKRIQGKYLLVGGIVTVLIVLCIALVLMYPKISAEEQSEVEVVIDTPYCRLYYPGNWKDSMRTEVQAGDPYIVSFYGKTARDEEHALFDVVFGESTGFNVGYVAQEAGKPVAVSVVYHDVEHNPAWTEAEGNTLYTMQEDAGYLIDRIPLVQQPVASEESGMEIQTPYGILYYPEKWANQVKTQVSESVEYVVTFSGCFDDIWCPLFDIVFNGDTNAALGYVRTEDGTLASVEVQTYELQDNMEWTPELEERFYEMQEGLNDVLVGLSMESKDGGTDESIVETPYCNLRYTTVWGSSLYTETVEDNGDKIIFYGKVGEIEPQPLFEICFGESQGALLGWVTDQHVPVYLTFFELDPKWDWPQENVDNLYGMQEEINVIIENLNQEQDFEPAA